LALPSGTGTIGLPNDFIVEAEDDGTLLAHPKGDDAITLRASTLILNRKDGQDETAGRVAVQDEAKKRGLRYWEIADKGVISYEGSSEQNGVPLRIKYWYIGSKNTFVIFSATTLKAKMDSKPVKAVLDQIPRILDSIKITKLRRLVTAEDRQVEAVVTTVEPFPQTTVPFGSQEEVWLHEALERARALGIKYGGGGDLTPQELDVVFSRWMEDDEEKETDDAVANALGAAFGEYLVEGHGFRWVVVTDTHGTEYAVRYGVGESMAFPRTSVQKRIASRCREFFQDLYVGILDHLARNTREREAT